jgi:hypothetical protein
MRSNESRIDRRGALMGQGSDPVRCHRQPWNGSLTKHGNEESTPASRQPRQVMFGSEVYSIGCNAI